MRVVEVQNEEDRRLDLLLMRTMNGYTARNLILFSYFNPRMDILNLTVGTRVWVPDEDDIAKVVDIRGYYKLDW